MIGRHEMSMTRKRRARAGPRGGGAEPGTLCVEGTQPPRVALYSHDTQGLGHIKRNLAIARALGSADPAPEILLISGVPEARAFALPEATNLVTLPTVRKTAEGQYLPYPLRGSLEETIAQRTRLIQAAVGAFAPDVLIVDKVARGLEGELEPTLRSLRARGGATVLGLRDVLDAPAAVRRDWAAQHTTEAVRDLYDAVWVYGDPRVFDPIAEYRIPEDAAAKVSYTGYLARRPAPARPTDLPDVPFALCLVGGGQDGGRLAAAFLDAPLPEGLGAVVVTGPYMSRIERERLQRQAAGRPGRQVLHFVTDCDALLSHASAVVTMGGYNTVCAVLAHGKRALVVPRTTPREEQLVRAQRLAARGLVDVLRPEALTAAGLGSWIGDHLGATCAPDPAIDLDGLAALPGLLRQRLAGVASERMVTCAAS